MSHALALFRADFSGHHYRSQPIEKLVHALTLPTEFDASFGRALPLIRRHALLRPEDFARARKLLLAAALTYVSGALQSLLNIARWWAILRR